MKKVILYFAGFILLISESRAQFTNVFTDSSYFKRGVKFNSTVIFGQGAGYGNVLTGTTTTGKMRAVKLGTGLSFSNDTLNSATSSNFVDSILANVDSIAYYKNSIRYHFFKSNTWSSITSTPTTIAGYGITDAYTKTSADARYFQIGLNLSEGTAATMRINLGGTGVGINIFTSTNPSAITFLRANADNTVTWRSASNFRSDIGAGTGNGDALVANPLSQFAATTSSQLAGIISDETGSGALTFGRKVDTLYFNTGNDSLIYTVSGTRYALAKTAFAFAKNAGGDSIILTINGTRYAVLDRIATFTYAKNAGGDSTIANFNNVRSSAQDVTVSSFAFNTGRDSVIILLNNGVRFPIKRDSTGGGTNVASRITMFGTDYSSTTAGTWTKGNDPNQMLVYLASNTGSQTQNDQANYLFGCTSGTYTIQICYILNTTFGIATILIDGVSVGTIDCYGSLTYNQFTSTTGVAITAGQHTVSIKMATKNASASAYGVRITYITLWRTGA